MTDYKWTCNPSTGAIFDHTGRIIGVADKTSAISITEMHNRMVDEVMPRKEEPSFYEYLKDTPPLRTGRAYGKPAENTDFFYERMRQQSSTYAQREPVWEPASEETLRAYDDILNNVRMKPKHQVFGDGTIFGSPISETPAFKRRMDELIAEALKKGSQSQ